MSAQRGSAKKIIILTVVSFSLALSVFLSNILGIFELKAYDLFSRYLNPSQHSDNIVIVQVDQRSLDSLSREGVTWPWPRQIYAPIIDYLSEADAVFMDILFTEPSSYGQEDDMILAEAFRKSLNVYLPIFLTRQKNSMSAADEEFIRNISLGYKMSTPIAFTSAVVPIDTLKDAVMGAGNVTTSPDEDGVYRRTPLVFKLKQYAVPHFILSYLIRKDLASVKDGSIYVKDEKIPLADGRFMMRYCRDSNPFRMISAVDVLKSSIDSSVSGTPSVKKDFFKGKVVFIGLTAAGLYDLKPTSISSISTGVLIHATVLDNIIKKNFVRRVNDYVVIVFMLAISLLTSLSVLRHHSIYRNLSLFTLSMIVIFTTTALLFRNALYMEIIPPFASLLVSFIIAVAYSYATEGKERLFIKKTFSQYMDKQLVEYVLKNPSLIKPGGKRKFVTVFFADMAGFTSIAEKVSAEKTAMILHEVLNAFTEVIIKNSGVIDKYIGDSIMAFWGAPLETKKDEINACRAAIQCIESLNEINRKFRAEGLAEISMRTGIHSGDVIAGNLGSDRLFDYTVVGDTVNLASRLESVNKVFGTGIIISEATYLKAGDMFLTRELGLIEVKGKTAPVKIFELVGEKGKIHPEKAEMVMLFHKGLAFYKELKWHRAVGVFDSILEKYPMDGPSAFYKKRCEYLIANPQLTGDWNIVKMTEK